MGSMRRYERPQPYGAVVRSGPLPLVPEAIPSALLAVGPLPVADALVLLARALGWGVRGRGFRRISA